MKPGRNDPCPCGSGKKYKKCCGAASSLPVPSVGTKNRDYIALNKAIAYKGKIGKMREDFCIHNVDIKKELITFIEKDLTDKVVARGETITCHKGCSYCCSQFVGVPLEEVETIVYYLYSHETVLNNFVKSYPIWRAKVRESEAVYNRVLETFNMLFSDGRTETNLQAYNEASISYLKLNIPCPFLDKNTCSIYEVRPYACASVVAITPGEWCSPANDNICEVRMSNIVPKHVPYFREPSRMVLLPTPLGVYEILAGGFLWLSDLPGLKGLDNEVMTDPEVRPIIRRYL